MNICQAQLQDLQEILSLQYLAFKSVALQFTDQKIQPLTQTLEELRDEYYNGIILKMTNKNNKIIGSIRARENNETVYIGKLIVHPDYQRHGYGTMLLNAIEKYYTNKRYELFTSSKSPSYIPLYEKNGYKIFSYKKINNELEFAYMEKN
ncbi:MAG: GNAT family N-acetyltransferase [Desulfovibrio sp.]|nr:GNAT family N-acetyltransferase [Desulfovibrio sp.]